MALTLLRQAEGGFEPVWRPQIISKLGLDGLSLVVAAAGTRGAHALALTCHELRKAEVRAPTRHTSPHPPAPSRTFPHLPVYGRCSREDLLAALDTVFETPGSAAAWRSLAPQPEGLLKRIGVGKCAQALAILGRLSADTARALARAR